MKLTNNTGIAIKTGITSINQVIRSYGPSPEMISNPTKMTTALINTNF
ncbi:hypothetical protein ACSFV5_09855 [Acinetobacter sp. HC8-3S]